MIKGREKYKKQQNENQKQRGNTQEKNGIIEQYE